MEVKLSDIAKRATVSTMTVSRVINGEKHVAKSTREKVERIMKEMNYQPNLIAQSLSSKKSMTLGVILSRKKNIFMDNYIAQAISGITDVAQEHKYRITLLPVENVKDDENVYVNFIRSKLVDGLLLLSTKINDPALEKLADSSLPFVAINYKNYDERFNFVDSKNKTGAKMAVKHLYKKGRRKIAFLNGSSDETNSIDRLNGYKEALKELGLPFNEKYIEGNEFDKEIAYQSTEKLLNLPTPPDAIFCADDYMAIGAIEKINARGLNVPKDISIVGFDDIVVGSFYRPSLTTVHQPIIELGRCAAESLLELLGHNAKKPIHKFLDVELIERESS